MSEACSPVAGVVRRLAKVRRTALVVLGTAVSLSLVAGCGNSTPSGTPSTSVTTPPSQSGTPVEVTAFFVGDTSRGPRIYPETRSVVTTDDAATAALKTAFAAPLDPDYHSAWQDTAVTVNSVTRSGKGYVVDLSGLGALRNLPGGMSEAMASAALDQVLWTVKESFDAEPLETVRILNDGQKIDQVLGVPTGVPLAFGDPLDVLALVSITSIQEGDTVTSPVHVAGLGAAFEAQLVWRIFDDSGKVVKKGTTLAEECCRMAPYSFDVNLDPGTYTIEVTDTDPSGGEGFAPWQDSKTFTVS